MRVARHEMPGTCLLEARPVGYGMIGWREGAIVSDRGTCAAPQFTPFPTGRIMSTHYQGFHAWLPSGSPSGTKLVPFVDATRMGSCRTGTHFDLN